MPIPWLLAMKVIPWGTILAKAPAIARAADTLLAGAHARKAGASAELQSLTDRVAALEKHDQADAELLKQLADQVAALATATEVLAARQRWLSVLWILLVGVALIAALVVGSR